jgi:hypothetical protein
MKEIIEQKGKPCCINMITESDRRFLANLENEAKKKAKAKAKEDEQPDAHPVEGEGAEHPAKEADESEQEVDEISQLIEQEEQQARER